jgi:tRNA A58 N-methylase Trm61
VRVGSCPDLADLDVIARELSGIGEKIRELEQRVTDVEKVNAQLENAALTTSRALEEISRHWEAVYEAMRRAEVAVHEVEPT